MITRDIKKDIKNILVKLGYMNESTVDIIYRDYTSVCDGSPLVTNKKELEKILGRNVPLDQMTVSARIVEKLLKLHTISK